MLKGNEVQYDMNNLNYNESWIMRLRSWASNIFTWSVVIISVMGLFLVAPACGFHLLVNGFFSVLNSVRMSAFAFRPVLIGVIQCGLGIYCFVIEWRIVCFCFTKHSICVDGIEACFLHKRPKLYSWSVFQEVCVCYEDDHTKVDNKLICFVQKGEKKNIFGRWKSDAFWRYPRIIRLKYTPELHKIITDLCPIPIVDRCK